MSKDNEPTEFLWNTHSYINEYIRFADTKAELVIGWTSAVIGVLIAGKYQDHFGWQFDNIVAAAGLALLVGSILCAFLAINPRLRTTQKTGFIFWQNIVSHASKEEFVAKVLKLDCSNQSTQVAEHLHDLSKVCVKKYRWANASIIFSVIGSSICLAMYLWFHCASN